MNTITLRLPTALQTRLQQTATANHRSLNKQATVLLEQALQNMPTAPTPNAQTRFDALMAIGKAYSKLPVLDTRSDNDIIGYDDHGLPT